MTITDMYTRKAGDFLSPASPSLFSFGQHKPLTKLMYV